MNQETFIAKSVIEDFVDEIEEFGSIPIDEMPEYRLFVSQIEEFFENKLGGDMEDDSERKFLSKTMIQNYIKDGLLMSPEGKFYNRDHIILLAVIHNLKSILPIKDIRKLMIPILEVTEDNRTCEIEHIYNAYLSFQKTYLDDFMESLEQNLEKISEETCKDSRSPGDLQEFSQILLVLVLIAQANIHKRLAERIIEKYFPTDD